MPFLDADYSAIEARIVNWLAGQEDALEEYRAGVDRYKRMASFVYGVPEKDVNKHPQRFVGKQCILGCIAEGELVLTDSGLVPIEKVFSCHRLWDGVEWVNHEGLIYQGEKQVISYQGLIATPDHPVYCVGLSRATNLWKAKQQKLRLALSGEGRTPLRAMDFADEPSVPLQVRLSPHEGPVRVWNGVLPQFQHSLQRSEPWVRSMRSRGQQDLFCPQMVNQAVGVSPRSLQQPTLQTVSRLWREGNRVQFRVSLGSCKLGDEQSWFETAFGVGPGEQQWPLRAGEFEVCYSPDTGFELPDQEDGFYISSRRVALLMASSPSLSLPWDEPGTSSRSSSSCCEGKTQTMESNSETPRTMRTYDILNAGPRHRFTVSGKLVHNCGFGMGPTKFRVTCKKMGNYDLPMGVEQRAVKAFRAKHKRVVSFWYDMESAAKRAIVNPRKIFPVGKLSFCCKDIEGTLFLLMRLPSGRKLAYPRPRLSGDRITFFGNTIGTNWGDVSTWGGTLVENAVQAVAADVMACGAHNAEREGYAIATLIHDQALAYHREGQTVERFVELLTTFPDWAAGLPIAAEGGIVPFYRKD